MLDHPTYEFTDSHGGVHVIEGWYYDYGHHTTKYDINVPVFTTWLHDVEFKEPSDVAEELVRDDDDDSKPSDSLWAESLNPTIKATVEQLTSDTDALWEAYLDRILADASYRDKPEQLNEELAWAVLAD